MKMENNGMIYQAGKQKARDMLKTPFYYVKEKDLQYDVDMLRSSLDENWENYIMSYSVKTNNLPWLLLYLKEKGFYAEVVSETEYDLACRLGFENRRIVYNGPIKDRKAFEKVLLAGGYVNMDSSEELAWMEELSFIYPNRKFKVGVRVNFDIARLCPEEDYVENGGRFGYCYETGVLKQVIERMNGLGNVMISGLHLHFSSRSRAVSVYEQMARLAIEIAREYELNLDYIDMGGGYFGGLEGKQNYHDYFKAIGAVLHTYFTPEQTKLIVEPGVSLISRAMSFETSVKDVKQIRDVCFVVTDGSRVNLNPLTSRQDYANHIVWQDDAQTRSKRPSQWICGFTCMDSDRLFELKEEAELKPGDRIVYDRAGGYTMCLTPMFIQYSPAVYLERADESIVQLRETWGNEEFLQKNRREL